MRYLTGVPVVVVVVAAAVVVVAVVVVERTPDWHLLSPLMHISQVSSMLEQSLNKRQTG